MTCRVTQLCKWWSWDSNPGCLAPKPELFPPLHSAPLTFWDLTVGTLGSEHKLPEAESLGHQPPSSGALAAVGGAHCLPCSPWGLSSPAYYS